MDEATGTGVHPEAASITHHVVDLRRLIDGLHQQTAPGPTGGSSAGPGGGTEHLEALQHLETAYEELRVAEEEVRAQQEEITDLLQDRQRLRSQHERMLATLPVPVLGTDLDGVVRSANAAATAQLAARTKQLVGKPLVLLVEPDDRPTLRALLAAARAGEQEAAGRVGLAGADDALELSVTPNPGDEQRLTWLLSTAPVDGRGGTDPALPAALVALASVPAQVDSLQALLSEAVTTCAAVVGSRAAVSVVTGSPLEPEAAASSSQLAQTMDGVQLLAGCGPSPQAFTDAATTWTSRVADDPRWPALHSHVPPGVEGVVVVPLRLAEEPQGVLSVYLPTSRVDPAVVETAELLGATVAAIVHELVVRSELTTLAEQMERALASRAVIDQAKGIIMGDKGWDADRAFAHLVSLSSSTGLKVRDVARTLVERATAPEPRRR
jgi:PAS domain-containing protein